MKAKNVKNFFLPKKIFIEIGPIQIAWYAILILTGAYLAYYLSEKNLKKVGYKQEQLQ